MESIGAERLDSDGLEADFIAFERNGSTGTPFESGSWTFNDGRVSIAAYHDHTNPTIAGRILAFGNLTDTARSRGNDDSFSGFRLTLNLTT